jgi:hypothetical protein
MSATRESGMSRLGDKSEARNAILMATDLPIIVPIAFRAGVATLKQRARKPIRGFFEHRHPRRVVIGWLTFSMAFSH